MTPKEVTAFVEKATDVELFEVMVKMPGGAASRLFGFLVAHIFTVLGPEEAMSFVRSVVRDCTGRDALEPVEKKN
jgi:hypothetical protein